ncbi:type II secretion system GspH family protein [Bacteriovoracaceae bacterium]|nr:type II secretion system GspH family protein [Bacteriovoracaceae bacterium]
MRKLKQKSILDQIGFTLIEIVISIAILGGLALVIMQLMNVQVGVQEASEINEDMVTLSSQILGVLNHQESCTQNFSGIQIVNNPSTMANPSMGSENIAQIQTANGRVIMQSGQQFNNSDLDIRNIYIDVVLDDPFLVTSQFHIYRAELVVEITKTAEMDSTPGVRQITKRFPMLLDYSIHQAYSMTTVVGVDPMYVQEQIKNRCEDVDFADPDDFVGHDVYKVFCNNINQNLEQTICTGICQVKDVTDISVTRCL